MKHTIDERAYSGYGIYEYDTPYGQMPGGLSIPGMPTPEQAITLEGGLKVLKPEYRRTAVGLLDQTTFSIDEDFGDTVFGKANIILGSLGTGWATQYLQKGFAILGRPETLQSGTPSLALTTMAQTIADFASPEGPRKGEYVVVDAPPALLAKAQALAELPPGGVEPEPVPPLGPPPPPPPPPPTPQPSPPATAAAMPDWVLLVVIGGGVLAVVALLVTGKKK